MSQIKKKYIADKAIDGSKILLLNNDALKALNASGVEQSILKFNSSDALEFSVLPEFSADPVNGNQLTRKAYVDSKVSTEKSRAESAESLLSGRLDVVEGSDTTEGSIRKALKDAKAYTDQEVAAEESARMAAVSAEQARAEGEEERIEGKVDQEISDRQAAISQEASARQAAVSAEESRAMAAESALDARLDIIEGADNVSGSVSKALKDAKAYADQKISDLVGGAPQILDTLKELSDALGGDANFASSIASQLSGLDGRLDVIEGDQNTSGSIAKALKDAKAYTDSKFQESSANLAEQIAQEILDRQADVDAEEARAIGEEARIEGKVDQEISDRQAAVSAEQSRAEAAEQALDGRLDILEGPDSQAGSVAKALKDAKAYTDSEVSSERSRAESAEQALDGRLDIIEGPESQAGSIAKALKDAKDYTDSKVAQEVSDREDAIAAEQSARENADSALDARLDVIEGPDSQVGSIAKALKDAKEYTDAEVAAEAELREMLDNSVSNRLDIIEDETGSVSGSMYKYFLDGKAYTDQEVASEESARQAAISAEQTARQNADNALDARLDVLEGADNVVGSVAKAEKDSKAYTDQKIADLVNGAPAVLDTLKELADALGSDPNFASTIAGQISGLDSRLDVVEGDENTAGSIAKALKDAKAYTDSEMAQEVSDRNAAIAVEQSRAEAAEMALDGRVDALEAVAHRKAKFVLSSGDISNGYIELPMEAISGSEMVFVGPLFVYEGDEYSVSVVGGKTRITFMGELASGGNTSVASGDVIYVRYMK